MRTAEIADLLDMRGDNLARLATAIGYAAPIGSGYPRSWSPGDALAFWVLRELGGLDVYLEGAQKCAEALDNGYRPAYLITRGHGENVVVIETDHPDQTDEMVAALLLQASDAGAAVKVVRLREMVRRLEPFLSELVSA